MNGEIWHPEKSKNFLRDNKFIVFSQKKKDATDNLNLRGCLFQHPAHFFLPHCRACDLAIAYFILTIKWLSTWGIWVYAFTVNCSLCHWLLAGWQWTCSPFANLQSVMTSNQLLSIYKEYYDQWMVVHITVQTWACTLGHVHNCLW